MKTPIQKLIDKLEERKNKAVTGNLKTYFQFCIDDAEQLLETEKQVIIDAYDCGLIDYSTMSKNDGEDYYQTTFKNH